MTRNEERELTEVVFNIDDKRFKILVTDGYLNNSVFKDIHFFNGTPLPLHYITICWDIILSNYNEWKEGYRDIVYKRKCQNDKIKEVFVSQFGIDMDDILYSNYCDYYYSQPEDATVEDCLWETKENLIGQGVKEIDIDLYCSVVKFDYEQAEHLLQCGANPRAWIPCEGENQCMDRIGTECSFLEIELDRVIMGSSYVKDYERDLMYLIGLAAHEKMYRLLSKYDKK